MVHAIITVQASNSGLVSPLDPQAGARPACLHPLHHEGQPVEMHWQGAGYGLLPDLAASLL